MKTEKIKNDISLIISKATKIPLEDISHQTNLIELGIDSLLFTQIKSTIQNIYVLDIPVAHFFSSLPLHEKIPSLVS